MNSLTRHATTARLVYVAACVVTAGTPTGLPGVQRNTYAAASTHTEASPYATSSPVDRLSSKQCAESGKLGAYVWALNIVHSRSSSPWIATIRGAAQLIRV